MSGAFEPRSYFVSAAVKTIEIDAPIERVYAVIVDYERYPEFLPEIERAEVVRRDGDVVEVAFSLNLIKRLAYTLRLVGEPERGVSWTLVDGMFTTNAGSWTLEPLDGGRTLATYSIQVAVQIFVPGSITKRLVGSTLPTTLAAFKARAEAG
jgi:ribosome-associated toxin RatA of RatAB toxin-antitoxin module